MFITKTTFVAVFMGIAYGLFALYLGADNGQAFIVFVVVFIGSKLEDKIDDIKNHNQ